MKNCIQVAIFLIISFIIQNTSNAQVKDWSVVDDTICQAGTTWSFAVYNGSLYAGGGYCMNSSVKEWNGVTWVNVGAGFYGYVYDMVVFNNELYVAGSFVVAGGAPSDNIVRWDGTTWKAVGTGVNNSVFSLCVYNGALYAGGYFTSASGVAANRIAKWDGSNWSALGSGITGGSGSIRVEDMEMYSSDLYVGGYFTTAGGIVADNIAKWNGTTWSTVGSGISGSAVVYDLQTYKNELYTVGGFTQIGSTTVNHIAKWNGSSWNSIGTGMNSMADVRAMAIYDSSLYVAGDFTSFNGVAALGIARWDSINVHAMGSGLDGLVRNVIGYSGEIYASGEVLACSFTNVNEVVKYGDLLAPKARFSVDTVKTCEDTWIHFNDESSCPTTSWKWIFQGGFPATSTLDYVGVKYFASGIYDVTLIAFNAAGSDTLELKNYITVYKDTVPTISQNMNILTSSPGASYKWYRNGIQIGGATMMTYTITQTGYYQVRVSNFGCTNMSDSVLVLYSGIGGYKDRNFLSVYPNPSDGVFSFETNENLIGTKLVIGNILGERMYQTYFNSAKLKVDMSAVAPGIYFYNVISDDKIITTGKIVKE